MEYKKYNPIKEKGACIIRTFKKLFNKKADQIRNELNILAQELNYDNYKEIEVFEEYLFRNHYFKIHDFDQKLIRDIELDDGKYAVFCYDKEEYYHMFAVIDNVVYDKSEKCFDLYVISVYKLN